jgi:purine-nucleoside phosphorylase
LKFLPEFFQLKKYNITPGDVVRMLFRCDPESIHPDVILMPWWQPEVFALWVDQIKVVTPDTLFEVEYGVKSITIVRSGIGAPQSGDAVLALGCTQCERLWFTGSIGGLQMRMCIGDFVIPTFSYSGDGYCRYLQPGFPPQDCFSEPVFPDDNLSAMIAHAVSPLAREAGIPVYSGPVFSTDSILAEFCRLDQLIDELGCIGVEMETAAIFKAARLVGIRAAALFSVSDVPVRNQSLFAGRPEEDKIRRREVHRKVLAKALLDCIGSV